MDATETCPLAEELADRLRAAKEELTTRWLERIAARVSLDATHVFPTDDLLDHVPLLIVGIADYLANPADELAADAPVIAKARELGALRHAQGFSTYEILKEHEILGGVLFSFLARTADEIDEPCTRGQLLICAHRVFHGLEIVQQATATHFLEQADREVHEREARLRRFNRMVSHELKNRVAAIVGAHALLTESWVDDHQRAQFLTMIGENAEGIHGLLDDIVALTRIEGTAQRPRHVLLPQAAAEAVRQLREMAQSHSVVVRIADDLPRIEVNAAAVELCLTNYLSNALKYSDPNKPERWIEIRGWLDAPAKGNDGCDVVVAVRDNGRGVPEHARPRLFDRFYRGDDDTVVEIEGTGLGLSIVRETAEGLGGRVWADFDEPGITTFCFALPCDPDEARTARKAAGD